MQRREQPEDRRAEKVPTQCGEPDAEQRTQAHRWEEDPEWHFEHPARDGGHDAQSWHQSAQEHRARAVLLQPAFGRIEALWSKSDEATVAVDKATAGQPRGPVEEARA